MGMCTRDEVVEIVKESENRLLLTVHSELEKLRVEVREDRQRSHMALDKTISNVGAEIIRALAKMESFQENEGRKITNLETWKAVHESEAKEINAKLTTISNNLSKLLWIFITGFCAALMGLIFIQ